MARTRRGAAFAIFIVSAAAVVVASFAIGYFHPENNDNWVWYGKGTSTSGIFFGARHAAVCLVGKCAVDRISKLNEHSDAEDIADLDGMEKAGNAAFYSTILGVIFLGIFSLWMLMATVGSKHAHVHGRHCSILAAIAFALAFVLWLAYRPHYNGFVEKSAFWAVVAACGVSLLCYVFSFFVKKGHHEGYARI